jgi:hypothetical protein
MKRPRQSGRGLAFVLGLALIALLAGGCGGSKTPAVASLATTNSAGSAAPTSAAKVARTRGSLAALAKCFASHGLAANVGSDGSGGELTFFGVTIGGNIDPDSPRFQAAAEACRKFIPGGGPPSLSPAQEAKHTEALARFAACMRKERVSDFPDPDGQGRFPFASLNQLDPNAPVFQAAYKTCQPLLPTFGPQIAFR